MFFYDRGHWVPPVSSCAAGASSTAVVCARQSSAGLNVRTDGAAWRAVSEDMTPTLNPANTAQNAVPARARRSGRLGWYRIFVSLRWTFGCESIAWPEYRYHAEILAINYKT